MLLECWLRVGFMVLDDITQFVWCRFPPQCLPSANGTYGPSMLSVGPSEIEITTVRTLSHLKTNTLHSQTWSTELYHSERK